MNITTSTSSSEVNTTSSQTKTSSSAKTSDKSFDEEMISQQVETQETTSQEQKLQEKSSSTEDETITNQTVEKESSQSPDKILSGNATYLDSNILLNNQQNNMQIEGSNQTAVQNFIANNKINPDTNELLNSKQLATENLLAQNQTILTQNIQDIVQAKDLMKAIASAKTVENYDVINMSNSDAEFFINLVQNTDMSMQSIATQTTELLMQNSEGIQQNIKVSSVLMEKLSESIKTNQPFRIDFDKDISVIIKVNKDGSLSANFIPGDKAVEQYLKNNIGFLKQRFDDENLSYSELSYSNHKNQQEQKRKKENDNE